MNTTKTFFNICIILLFISLSVVILSCLLAKETTNDISPHNYNNNVKNDITEEPNEKTTILAKQSDSNLTVNPTLGLDELMISFEEEIIRESESQLGFALEIKKLEDYKESGGTMWDSDNWMKDLDYYNSLTIQKLSEECFSKPIFSFELAIFDDPRLGYERLKMFHNGFQVLFQRSDMWAGILHTYEYLSSKLNIESDLVTIVEASGNLYELKELYAFPEFKEQVKGREKIFLAANLKVLKQYDSYLENYDPIKLGSEIPFFCEPCSVAQVALMLTHQVDPKRYYSIESEVKNIRWPKEQNIQDLKDFIKIIVNKLEGVVPID